MNFIAERRAYEAICYINQFELRVEPVAGGFRIFTSAFTPSRLREEYTRPNSPGRKTYGDVVYGLIQAGRWLKQFVADDRTSPDHTVNGSQLDFDMRTKS